MTQPRFLDTGRCSDLLNSTVFLSQHAGGRLVYSCSLSCGLSCKTALNSELWTRSTPSWDRISILAKSYNTER
jgi:hypothetical protein